ncbi:MAG: hypothetical protein ACI9VS_003579, partial [Candidatus Binatia bacterium]
MVYLIAILVFATVATLIIKSGPPGRSGSGARPKQTPP